MWQSAPESVRNSAIAVPFGRGALFTAVRDPLRHFFTERYAESYAREIDDFIDSVEAGREPSVTFDDGYRALVLAAAADESLATGRAVTVAG